MNKKKYGQVSINAELREKLKAESVGKKRSMAVMLTLIILDYFREYETSTDLIKTYPSFETKKACSVRFEAEQIDNLARLKRVQKRSANEMAELILDKHFKHNGEPK